MDEVFDFLKRNAPLFLATTDGERPYLRPVGAVNFFEGKVYVQTNREKPVGKQIAANPNAAICVYDGKNALRISCQLVEDMRPEAVESMLQAYPFLREKYEAEDTDVVYCLANGTATFAPPRTEGAPDVIKF
ncbi:MAG: pyridoxamine 5'-phosphate oxidase family protein [Coriobacteriia bacterium]|nr:pyridoxamine 5'-phosphate oxidase family protein [Coriobacteriia bacterium]